MTERQKARILANSASEIAIAIRAVPVSTPHARATQLPMYTHVDGGGTSLAQIGRARRVGHRCEGNV